MPGQASHSPLLQTLSRHDRTLAVALLLLIVILSWSWLLSGAGTMQEMGGMTMPMSSGPWTVGHAALMFSMWSVMMAAMMLPSAMPMILFHSTVASAMRTRGGKTGSTAVFAAGYLAVWIAFGAAATALQYVLEQTALLSPMMETTSTALAGILLLAGGLYQWSPLKQSCLRHCRSPMEFLMTQWRPGTRGAYAMGVKHGLYCVGCCWALMLLLFVGGVMNMMWIVTLAIFVLLEKLVPRGRWLGLAAGVLLAGWGIFLLARLPA